MHTARTGPVFHAHRAGGRQTLGYIYLNYPGSDGNYRMDSTKLSEGRFTFNGNIDGPSMSGLSWKGLLHVV